MIEIIRDRTRLLPNVEGGLLENGDILLVQGDLGTLVGLRDSMKLRIKALTVEDRDLEDDSVVLVEAFISPDSRLVDSTLREINFRQTFQANRGCADKIHSCRFSSSFFGNYLIFAGSRRVRLAPNVSLLPNHSSRDSKC